MQTDFEFTSKDTKTYIGTQNGGSFSGWNAVLNQEEVVDNLESTATDLPLSANQGTQLFNDVSTGKAAIASAITDKQIETASTATFQTMAENIGQIGATPLFNNIKFTHLGVQQPDSYYGMRTGFKKGEYNLLLSLSSGSDMLGETVYDNDTISYLNQWYFPYFYAYLFKPTGDEVEFFDENLSSPMYWILVEGINELLENGYNFDWIYADATNSTPLINYVGKENTLLITGSYAPRGMVCTGDILEDTGNIEIKDSTYRRAAVIANLKDSGLGSGYKPGAWVNSSSSTSLALYDFDGLIFYKK